MGRAIYKVSGLFFWSISISKNVWNPKAHRHLVILCRRSSHFLCLGLGSDVMFVYWTCGFVWLMKTKMSLLLRCHLPDILRHFLDMSFFEQKWFVQVVLCLVLALKLPSVPFTSFKWHFLWNDSLLLFHCPQDCLECSVKVLYIHI